MTSGGTNFHIWHNSKLAKIKATDAKSSSSLISMLQSALNQQVETLHSLFYELKTVICMVTRLCPRPGGTDLDVGTIELPCKSQFSTHGERTEGPLLADSQLSVQRTRAFGEKFRLSSRPTRCYAIYGSWFHLTSRT